MWHDAVQWNASSFHSPLIIWSTYTRMQAQYPAAGSLTMPPWESRVPDAGGIT